MKNLVYRIHDNSNTAKKHKQYSEAEFSYCASVIKVLHGLLYSASAYQWSPYAIALCALYWECDMK